MRNGMTIAVAVIMLITYVVGDAQPLNTLIDTAMARNLAVKYRKAEYLAALERIPQVNRLPDPEVGVGGFLLPVETRTGAQRFRLSATQMTPWFGTLQAREDLVLAQAQAMIQPVEMEELNLSYAIKQSYFQLYEKQKMQQILRRSLGVLQVLRNSIIGTIESGQGSTADALRLDLRIREMEQQLQLLEADRDKHIAVINQVMNRAINNPIVVTDTFSFASIPVSTDTLLSHIMQFHPAIQRYVSQQEVSRKVIDLNEKDRKPSLGLGLDYIFISPRTDAQPDRNGRDVLQLRASVTVPIYGEKFASKKREEQLKIEALEAQKLYEASHFVSNIEKAIAEHESARLMYDLYTGQIEITKAALRILETDYSANGDNFDELLRLEMDLIDYDIQILKAVVRSHLAVAAIELYLTNLN